MPSDSSGGIFANPAAERRPASLAVQVCDRLRGMILDAAFELGEALSEDRLAASMGVSRTPVREALNMLQVQGLITILPQRGSFVFRPSEDDTRELCEFRMMLEGKALTLALVRRPQALVTDLRAATDEMAAALARDDGLAAARADSRFHDAFFAHAGNPYLSEAYGLASGRIATLRAHLARPRMLPRQGIVLAEHREIADALADRDHVRSEALLSAHIARMRDNYSRALREGDIVVRSAARRGEAVAAG